MHSEDVCGSKKILLYLGDFNTGKVNLFGEVWLDVGLPLGPVHSHTHVHLTTKISYIYYTNILLYTIWIILKKSYMWGHGRKFQIDFESYLFNQIFVLQILNIKKNSTSDWLCSVGTYVYGIISENVPLWLLWLFILLLLYVLSSFNCVRPGHF